MKQELQLASPKSNRTSQQSHSTENKMKFLAEAVVFHKHREEQEPPEEEVTSYSSEEEQCCLTVLHQLIGEPRSPPKSQALAMHPPPCK